MKGAEVRLRALALAAATASLLAAGAVPVSTAYAKQSGPNSFDGTCKLTGDFVFERPIGPLPQTMSFTDSATGTCSGKLNGVQQDSIPVVNTVTGWGTVSCSFGDAHTSDTLTFARRYPIHIFTDSAGALTQFVAHSSGAVSGESVEHVSLLPYTDQSTLEQCQAGALRSAHYDLDAQTLSPLVG
jgi:hypothetical protein